MGRPSAPALKERLVRVRVSDGRVAPPANGRGGRYRWRGSAQPWGVDRHSIHANVRTVGKGAIPALPGAEHPTVTTPEPEERFAL